MKFLFSLLSLLLLNKECESSKTALAKDSKPTETVATSSASKLMQDENMTISYTAQTRGTYKNVSISKTEIVVSDTRSETKTYPCSAEDWKAITDLLSQLNVETLSKLKAPSTDSYRDAALAANLTLKKDRQQISSPSFDHGNPPKEIEALVNKVLSVREKAQKQ